MKTERLNRLALALFCFVLAACGATQANETSQMQTSTPPPAENSDLQLYINTQDGYSLLYPSEYALLEPHYIVINPTHAAGDTLGDAWVDITVQAANGQTAAQTADVDIAAAGHGFNIQRSETIVGNASAIIVNGLLGPDPLCKVYIVHNDKLFTLTFMPWNPTPDGSSPLEKLFGVVTSTFTFID